ncbi:hypothetical protein ASPVEDRAFT_880803 [Aspergillus versicolor CBS 583.65]|uniref:Ketosynthase family 3 (KS3) domain-containing protein n=1 Tax=Aspergillus versicolor CBS 583.65 TaxID=1036611 RepID=A0A1L9P9P3_ASPVE|nr:uncharacterized protein ASPVEDRAFT_880803 [Aspergillus versicolor CBS 583.65]OJI98164.1 hypothetical protein ASPVEDRAFT_880803 [Aspergillus versicolor CBS 583.65]
MASDEAARRMTAPIRSTRRSIATVLAQNFLDLGVSSLGAGGFGNPADNGPGLSLDFPGESTTPEAFWNLILDGRPTAKEVPKDRYDIDAWYHPDAKQPDGLSHRRANFVERDLGRFDAAFFSITAVEAEAMDPQQRLILETSYRALENSGVPMESLSASKTCVYTRSFGHDYQLLQAKDLMTLPKFHGTGTSANMLANRVSWFFNLEGPSANVDTACSSSLMSIHLVCQSIRNGESSMAFLSKDGRSFSFDERANGYGRGEGVAGLVIRPLKDAIQNGDTIRAVIWSSGCNKDGKTPGVMQPSGARQEQLIRDTYARAGLDMGTTRYVEAHGTGKFCSLNYMDRAKGSGRLTVQATPYTSINPDNHVSTITPIFICFMTITSVIDVCLCVAITAL